MKRLILLAALFSLTSCDALTGAKPNPSTTPTPLVSESVDPNAPITSGVTGAETPGPTSSGSPSPSQMPTSPAIANNSAPAVPTTGGQPNLGTNQLPLGPITAPNAGVITKPAKTTVASPDQSSITPFISANPSSNSKNLTVKGGTTGTSEPTLKTPASATISDGSIGVARVGMTLAELKKNLKSSTRFETRTDFIPGFNALAVKQQGKVQFYIPYPKQQKIADGDQIKLLVTDNPAYKTVAGISPGMSIKKAAEVYGGAQLQNDPKIGELAKFADPSAGDLLFFTSASESNGRAGVYPVKQKKDQQTPTTDKYVSSGRIKRIAIVCSETVCP